MSKIKREIGDSNKKEIGARAARKLLPGMCISNMTNNSQNDNDTQRSGNPITVDLVNEEQEDPDFEEVTLERIMRFYNETGNCYVCDTNWSSETEVKKRLL